MSLYYVMWTWCSVARMQASGILVFYLTLLKATFLTLSSLLLAVLKQTAFSTPSVCFIGNQYLIFLLSLHPCHPSVQDFSENAFSYLRCKITGRIFVMMLDGAIPWKHPCAQRVFHQQRCPTVVLTMVFLIFQFFVVIYFGFFFVVIHHGKQPEKWKGVMSRGGEKELYRGDSRTQQDTGAMKWTMEEWRNAGVTLTGQGGRRVKQGERKEREINNTKDVQKSHK